MRDNSNANNKKVTWRRRTSLVVGIIFFWYFIQILPANLFDKPRSTVLYSSDGRLLNAMIAGDSQWRFPPRDSVPEKFKAALLIYEDKHFYEHSGVYLPSLFRAAFQNLSSQRVISGASTISMQVIRMSRDNPSRTLTEKLREMLAALRLEWRYSKDEIIALYASNAPFGGNVVGIDAAAWRYYGRNADQLSWAESATLAVLPNAPSMIFPGKNHDRLMQKRNRVLDLLFQAGYFDEETLSLSYSEPLPQKPHAIPQIAPHLLSTIMKERGPGRRYESTVNLDLQTQCNDILRQYQVELESNMVHNASILIVEVKTGNVLAYVGNTRDESNRYGNMVDIIRAPRSTGSILKPLLYTAMLKDGLILPNTLMPDVPMHFDGFSPKNYNETFDGAVPASQALSRSLNIPAVVMLKDYGYPRFCHLLQRLGFSHIRKPADHYGLSLILGGAEASLWDITHAYAGMSRTLVEYHTTSGKYFTGNETRRNMLVQPDPEKKQEEQFPIFDAGSIWCTYRALLEVNRPETELGWEAYDSYAPIAWKTGTSFGNRDAWAVGTTPEYVVGCWVGNADGQGRPLLTGLTAAAPLMFDVFARLQHRTWFTPPYDNLTLIGVCHESGMQPGIHCDHVDSVYVPVSGIHTAPCRFHQQIFTDATASHRLTAQCASLSSLFPHSWFVLPPIQEYYYKSKHPEYADLPPMALGCEEEESFSIGLIYPKSDAKIYVPRNISGQHEKVVLEATHRSNDGIIYWHLDGEFIGETTVIHKLETQPTSGKHVLTLVDSKGNSLVKVIEIIER